MQIRQPVAAGRFYPDNKRQLENEITHYLQSANKSSPNEPHKKAWGVMLPHAGYVFCGNIIGKVLSNLSLPQHLIILCPNHTGYGTPLSVWTTGEWVTPLGNIPVDSHIARQLVEKGCGFQSDTSAHLGEHSIETILPFLQFSCPKLEIVPVCVGTRNASFLKNAAKGLSQILSLPENQDVGIVISSDMNHYENEKITLAKDSLALQAALEMNPEKLLDITEKENISMCGAAPMALALFTANDPGHIHAELISHDTSGKVTGDYGQVVGYAGIRLVRDKSQICQKN